MAKFWVHPILTSFWMLQGIFDVDVNCLFFSSFILLVGLATQKDTLKTKNSSKEIQKWLHFPTSKPLSYNLLKNLDVWLNTTRCRLKMHQTKRLWKGTCWPQQKKSLRKLERSSSSPTHRVQVSSKDRKPKLHAFLSGEIPSKLPPQHF